MPLSISANQEPATAFRLEEERIRTAYAGRAAEACYAETLAGRFQFQERERQVLRMLDRHSVMPLTGRRILEIGCGTGKWLRDLIAWGAEPENVFGIELIPASAARARRLCPAGVTIECANGVSLPFDSGSFDMVLQATAFSSVLDSGMRCRMAAEMLRVLRPDGLILWWDMMVRNPWNLATRPVGKSELRRLFSGCRLDLRRVGLAPPVARRLAPYSWLACYLMARVPALCTHYIGVIRTHGVRQ